MSKESHSNTYYKLLIITSEIFLTIAYAVVQMS